MQTDGVVRTRLLQHMYRGTARVKEIFAMYFQKIQRRALFQHLSVMWLTQADAYGLRSVKGDG